MATTTREGMSAGMAIPPRSGRRGRSAAASIVFALVLGGLAASAAPHMAGTASAADVVELVRGADGKPGPIFRGEIVDIAGGRLTLRRGEGREDSIPWPRVAQYRTEWPAGLADADRLRQERRFAEAIAAYRAAAQAEPRGWVKRVLVARAIGCFREQNQPTRAGELFLGLYRTDPETPHFDQIPLAWLPPQSVASEPGDRDLRVAAPRWLADTAHPAAVLLGASWLISAGEPGSAIEPLRTLTQNADPRVALLAEAQLWRTRLTQAREADIDAWERIPPRLPATLRAGPFFTLGLAWQQSGQPERAALAFLRVPIEHGDQPLLAAAALESAAKQLELLKRPAEAARLRRERVTRFGGE